MPMKQTPEALERERAVAALTALAEHGIPTDIQELLIAGDPARGIAPGALAKAIRAAHLNPGQEG